MIEGDFADMCTHNNSLTSIGDPATGGARTPIGVSGNYKYRNACSWNFSLKGGIVFI